MLSKDNVRSGKWYALCSFFGRLCEKYPSLVNIPMDRDENEFLLYDTPLLIFALVHHLHLLIEPLIANGADPTVPDLDGRSPFYIAHKIADVTLFQLFCKNLTADSIMTMDGLGNTPLHYLMLRVFENSLGIIEPICRGATSIQNKKGETPLHWAVLDSSYVAVEFLINHKANINMKDRVEILMIQHLIIHY
eukprot:TRINITY_DN27223_c0_g1_i1.p1 TRINITY_DN27223_c0_g1~~TRINITY_DN27223_c0_g1_i1.p1  ORF type:complete len:209 (-),score=48.67 TRINITY_DN27223_c0_g1_i1:5-580(-)